MERLCKDCKHLKSGTTYTCHALDGKPNPLTGETMECGIQADTMRMTLCGWNDPKFWERRPASQHPTFADIAEATVRSHRARYPDA